MSLRTTSIRPVIRLFVVSATCIGLVTISSIQTVDIVAGLPLVIYLPGGLLILAIDATRRHLGTVERQVWTIAASCGLTICGGLVLNLVGGLTRDSWLIWISGVVCSCAAVGAFRLSGLQSADATRGTVWRLGWLQRLHISLRQWLLLTMGLIVCGLALVLSIHTNAVSTREAFVQSWVLPQPVDTASSPNVEIGIINHLGNKRSFVVHVTVGTGNSVQFIVTLADGASWTHELVRRPGQRVESAVATESRPSVIISRVYLATPVT